MNNKLETIKKYKAQQELLKLMKGAYLAWAFSKLNIKG